MSDPDDTRPFEPDELDLDDPIDDPEGNGFDDDDDELPDDVPRAMPPGSAARLDELPEPREPDEPGEPGDEEA